jgi:hypothetical protein
VREARYMRLISWIRHRGSEQYGMYRVGQSIVDYFLWVSAVTNLGSWWARGAKSARQQSKEWCKWWDGGWRALSLTEDCLPQIDRSELYAGQQHGKIWKNLSNSKGMVFNVKKLLNYDMDLMPQQRGGKKRCK